MHTFKSYKEAHTEWAIVFIKFCETVLSLVCMIYHLHGILHSEEPIPHNMLFCATFGGYFILGLSGMLVPFSGQLSPPGVDMMFAVIAFILLFLSANVAMHYVMLDPHLADEIMTDEEEATHLFFVHCKQHCVLSLITGTFFLMHAVISADRLRSVKRGLVEDLEEQEAMIIEGIPVIDITPETPITLHLFLLDWFIWIWNNTKCLQAIVKFYNSRKKKQVSVAEKKKKKQRLRQPHVKAHMKKLKQNEINTAASSRKDKTVRSSESPSKLDCSSSTQLIIEDERKLQTPRSLLLDVSTTEQQWPIEIKFKANDGDFTIITQRENEQNVDLPIAIIIRDQNTVEESQNDLFRRKQETLQDESGNNNESSDSVDVEDSDDDYIDDKDMKIV